MEEKESGRQTSSSIPRFICDSTKYFSWITIILLVLDQVGNNFGKPNFIPFFPISLFLAPWLSLLYPNPGSFLPRPDILLFTTIIIVIILLPSPLASSYLLLSSSHFQSSYDSSWSSLSCQTHHLRREEGRKEERKSWVIESGERWWKENELVKLKKTVFTSSGVW